MAVERSLEGSGRGPGRVPHSSTGADASGTPSAPDAASSPAVTARLAELKRAAGAFESILYKQMLHSMVEGSTEGGFFGKEAGGDTWEELFESGLSDSLGQGGGLGLASQIYRQYSESVRRQAESSHDSASTPFRSAGAEGTEDSGPLTRRVPLLRARGH